MKLFFYQFLYGQLFVLTIMIVFAGTVLWGKMSKHFSYHVWRIISISCFIIVILAILCPTVLIRGINFTMENRGTVVLQPFHFLITGKSSHEIYRVAAGNVLIFMPFGAIIAGMKSKTSQKNGIVWRVALLAIISGLLFSFLIELAQYFLVGGQAETDDLICNSFGALLGAACCVLPEMHKAHKQK